MKLTYDGGISTDKVMTLTGIPNILTIESDNITGSKATLGIVVTGLADVDVNKDYYITVNGQTITSKGTGDRSFYITNENSFESRCAVAYSIAKALKNCNLASYDIFYSREVIILDSVIIKAKEVGPQYNLTIETNLAELQISSQEGTTSDEFAGGVIEVDVYSNNDYIATLSKNYYKEKIDFNVSEILKSISKYDQVVPYTLQIFSNVNHIIRNLGTIEAQSVIGYMANQGEKYLVGFPRFAQNVTRGTQEGVTNKMVLYTYLPSIPISIYTYNSQAVTISVNYLSADKQVIGTGSYNIETPNKVGYMEIALDSNLFNQSYYIDVIMGDEVIRYNIIKPVDANSRCQRVYYHNSYGGVSFFDFTGEITEDHKVDNETYVKNIYNYYKDSALEETVIYDKETTITVTMKSHLMERSAIWQFNDFLGSSDMWTNINGVDYKIICTDVKVDQIETGVWQATAVYVYSLV